MTDAPDPLEGFITALSTAAGRVGFDPLRAEAIAREGVRADRPYRRTQASAEARMHYPGEGQAPLRIAFEAGYRAGHHAAAPEPESTPTTNPE